MSSDAGLVAKTKDWLQALATIDIDQLLNRPQFGDLNFGSLSEELKQAVDLAQDWLKLPVDQLPTFVLRDLNASVELVLQSLQRISNFSISGHAAAQLRQTISNQVVEAFQAFYSRSQSIIPLLALQSDALSSKKMAIDEYIGQVRSLFDDAVDQKGEIDKILVAAHAASAQIGVAKHSKYFSIEAAQLESSARIWLWLTAALAVISLVTAYFGTNLFPIPKDASSMQVLQAFTSKIVVIGILISATIWCGGLFRAAKHQAAINKHRANALSTFETFVGGTSDPETKNAVLVETTRSIFAIASSGYLNSTDSGSDNATKVLEVIKTVAGGTKKE